MHQTIAKPENPGWCWMFLQQNFWVFSCCRQPQNHPNRPLTLHPSQLVVASNAKNTIYTTWNSNLWSTTCRILCPPCSRLGQNTQEVCHLRNRTWKKIGGSSRFLAHCWNGWCVCFQDRNHVGLTSATQTQEREGSSIPIIAVQQQLQIGETEKGHYKHSSHPPNASLQGAKPGAPSAGSCPTNQRMTEVASLFLFK